MADSLAELMPKVDNIFEFLSVHREMIQDKVRTTAYRKAIFKTVKKGDVVLDVGTGTGLLAFYCIQAGASHVYAIEKTDIMKVARENARKNGCLDKIHFINEDSRTAKLPEKVDVIVSEVIGHFALEENMLDSIIDAKERFLKKGGSLIPLSVDLFFVPIEAHEVYESEIDFWCDKPDDIDFSAARTFAVNNVYIRDIYKENFLSDPKKVKSLNFADTRKINIYLEESFVIRKKGVLHGLAGWFNAMLCPDVGIDTSPEKERTHWKQCFFPIKEPVEVSQGDELSIKFGSKSLGEDVIWEWQFSINNGRFCSEAKLSTSNLLSNSVLNNFWRNSRVNKRLKKTQDFIVNMR